MSPRLYRPPTGLASRRPYDSGLPIDVSRRTTGIGSFGAAGPDVFALPAGDSRRLFVR
jgi:hypothetical protein